MNDVHAIKCKKCGAPAYSNQAREGFHCPYCGDFVPWATTRAHFTPDMVFRHRPLPIVDGLLKLTHVGMPEKSPGDPRASDEMSRRVRDMDSQLAELDRNAFKSVAGRELITAVCKHCGADITGHSTQNIFVCEYCGNKIMDGDTFADGVYRKEIFGYDNNMYNRAIPFSVSADEAKRQILRLIASYPKDFDRQDIAARIDTELQALYLPYRLDDVSLKATVETERGTFTFYQERVNWALPSFTLFDVYLLNELQPWDFGTTAPFAPAYLEGNVRIFAPLNNEERITATRRMLWRDVTTMVSAAFGFNRVKLLTWDYNFRTHKYAFFNLPVWFLDKRQRDLDRDLQIRMAVNGQTGKAAALFLQSGEKDYVRTLDANPVPKMSDDCTMYSHPSNM